MAKFGMSLLLKSMIRFMFFSSAVALTLAAVRSGGSDGPEWLTKPVCEACWGAGLALIAFWGVAEGMMAFGRGTLLRLWLLALACGTACVPCFYVLPAAWRGDTIADIQTWHLLPLFAVIHMFTVTALFGGLSGIVIILIRLIRSPSPKHHNTKERFSGA